MSTLEQTTPPPVPVQQPNAAPSLSVVLEKSKLQAYAQKFADVGYDDADFLRTKSKEELRLLLTSEGIAMLAGHADKFICYLFGELGSDVPVDVPTAEEATPDKHYISFIVDRSGSMRSMGGETVNGFNKFVEEQKHAQKEDGEAWLTLTTFDDRIEVVYDAVNLKDVKKVEQGGPFNPRGGTALLDAIGETINLTSEKVKELGCNEVTVVILTDGHENRSTKWKRPQIAELIKEKETKQGWEFIFLAANQDAIKSGQSFGISPQSAMTYGGNAGGMECAFLSVAQNYHSKRAHKKKMVFDKKQRLASARGCVKSMPKHKTRR